MRKDFPKMCRKLVKSSGKALILDALSSKAMFFISSSLINITNSAIMKRHCESPFLTHFRTSKSCIAKKKKTVI